MNDDFTKPDGSFSGANVNDFSSMHNDFGKFCKNIINYFCIDTLKNNVLNLHYFRDVI